MKARLVLVVVSVLIGILQCFWLTKAAEYDDDSMPFHPITEEEYDAILGLTAGEHVISEGRLIASGIAALKGLAAGLKLGVSASWLPSILSNLGNLGGTQRNATRNVLSHEDGYPLCVIRRGGENDVNAAYESNYGGSGQPIIRCIIVVKEGANMTKPPTTTTTQRPHRPKRPKEDYETYESKPDYDHSSNDYPYPYVYPWYVTYNGYPPYYPPDEVETHDFVPNTRYYPSKYESAYPDYDDPYYKTRRPYTKNKPKTRTKSKKRQRTPPTVNYKDYTSVPYVRRRKTKRDQHSENGQKGNYDRISSYPSAGYQKTSYPQFSYHSQYPKVSYSSAYNYPSPVYVGTTPQPSRSSSSEESSEEISPKM